jgi:hypothetical protein
MIKQKIIPLSDFRKYHIDRIQRYQKCEKLEIEFVIWLDEKGNAIPVAKCFNPMINGCP